jgi:hypothetical protein
MAAKAEFLSMAAKVDHCPPGPQRSAAGVRWRWGSSDGRRGRALALRRCWPAATADGGADAAAIALRAREKTDPRKFQTKRNQTQFLRPAGNLMHSL